MLTTKSKVNYQGQVMSLSGVNWQQFSRIQNAFDGISGVRLAYCEGVLEIMPLSKAHELICYQLGLFLGLFFLCKRIRFFPSGAYSQRIEGVTEYQSDLSYSFDTDKDVPDLCIEVVITSGGIDKLRKYQLRGVPEVWFYQDEQIKVYCLQDGDYQPSAMSRQLPDLDLAFLCDCVSQDDPLEASLQFQQRIAFDP